MFLLTVFFQISYNIKKNIPSNLQGWAFHGSYESLKEKQKKLERFDAKKVPVFAMTANAFI